MVKISGSNNFKQNQTLINKHPINKERKIKESRLGSNNSDLVKPYQARDPKMRLQSESLEILMFKDDADICILLSAITIPVFVEFFKEIWSFLLS